MCKQRQKMGVEARESALSQEEAGGRVRTMARRSGSKPKMSWNPISAGNPRLRRNEGGKRVGPSRHERSVFVPTPRHFLMRGRQPSGVPSFVRARCQISRGCRGVDANRAWDTGETRAMTRHVRVGKGRHHLGVGLQRQPLLSHRCCRWGRRGGRAGDCTVYKMAARSFVRVVFSPNFRFLQAVRRYDTSSTSSMIFADLVIIDHL